jgi:hypothetical protein
MLLNNLALLSPPRNTSALSPSKAGLLTVGPPTCGCHSSPAVLRRQFLSPLASTERSSIKQAPSNVEWQVSQVRRRSYLRKTAMLL